MGWLRRRDNIGGVTDEQTEYRQVAEWREPGTGHRFRREMPELHENGVLAARLMDALERIETLEQQVAGLDAEARRHHEAAHTLHLPTINLPVGFDAQAVTREFTGSLTTAGGWCTSSPVVDDQPADDVSAGQSPAVEHRLRQYRVSDHEYSAYCRCGWVSGDTSLTRARNRAMRHLQRVVAEAGETILVEIVP